MIEAVNSVVSNAPMLRGSAEQASVARSFAANPERVQEARELPQAPYVSPYIYMDVNYNKAVLQIRDSQTGDVVRQFPSETRLRAQLSRTQPDQPALSSDTPSGKAPDAPVQQHQQAAQAQVAAAALAKGAQASLPAMATVVTSA